MRTRVFWFAAAVVLLGCVGIAQQRGTMFIERDNAPKDWNSAADKAQLIVVARLKDRTFRQVQATPNPQSTFAFTDFTADVLEVIKNESPNVVDKTVVVSRPGGILVSPKGNKAVQEAYFPAWNLGTKLLLFLAWSDQNRTYGLIAGSDAAFEHDEKNNRAHTTGQSAFSKRQEGRKFEDILAEVRTASHRR